MTTVTIVTTVTVVTTVYLKETIFIVSLTERQVGETVVSASIITIISSWRYKHRFIKDVLIHLHRSSESRYWFCLATDKSRHAKVSG